MKQKHLGIIAILASILLIGFSIYQYMGHDKKVSEDKNEKTFVTQSDQEEEWDGDSVGLDLNYNEQLGDFGLNEEVLSLIDHHTDSLSDEMQMYLMSKYDIGSIESVSWDGLVTIDYINKIVKISFDINANENCTVQCAYSQNEESWNFIKL